MKTLGFRLVIRSTKDKQATLIKNSSSNMIQLQAKLNKCSNIPIKYELTNLKVLSIRINGFC